MNENLDQKSFWSSETIPVGKSPADMHQVGYDYLEKGTLHGLSDALRRSNGWCSRVFWFSVVTVALICEVIHVTFLLESALQSPTVTNMRYARVQELAMPFLTLCGHPTKLFDSDKLKENNLTLSVALTFASMYGMFDPSVPTVSDSDDEILFEKALKLNNQTFEGYSHSPNSKKLSLFLLNFTIDCENLLYGCQQGFSGAGVRKNCCDNFKPVMTGKGLCYAFDHSTWKGSKVAGVFTGISFYLNHSKLAFSDPVYNKSSKFGVLSDINIAVSNGLEQSPLTNNYVTVASGNDVQITVSTTRIKLLHTCEPNPQLDFYRDYTINNCVWERGFYKHPNSPFCSISFDLTKMGFDFVNSTGNGMVQGKEAENFTDCSPEYIRSFYLNNTMNYVEWITRIDVPKSTDVCPFPCDYWEHSISVMKNAESFEVAKPSSLVKVTRANMNPHVSEVEKLGWQDYLCLVGGAMGMWTGSSVVTILQVAAGNLALLLALLYKTNFYQRKNLASTTEVTLKIEQMLFHVEDQEQIGPNPEVGKDEEEVK